MIDDGDYSLVEVFGVDNGELDGLSPQEVFVLGFEYATISTLIRQKMPFRRIFHVENKARLKAACERQNVDFLIDDYHDDWSELVIR